MTTTATKERPILFSAPMVRAILDGRKTVTRRILCGGAYDGGAWMLCRDSASPSGWAMSCDQYGDHLLKCPFGVAGDRLWMRETWAKRCDYGDGGKGALYRADGTDPGVSDEEWDEIRWRPSIFMPRWASRITLEVVSVRVERLQEITEEEAKREGMPHGWQPLTARCDYKPDPRAEFALAWNELHGSGSWASNPWVWRIEFRRISSERT